MSFLFTAVGWLFALASGEVTVSQLTRAMVPRLRQGQAAARYWPSGLLYGALAAAAFTVLGVLPALQGALLAVLMLGADAWWLLEAWVKAARLGKGEGIGRRVRAAAAAQVKAGPQCLRADFRALLRLRRSGPQPRRHGAPQAAPAPAGPVLSQPPAARPARAVPPPREAPGDIPSVRDDPSLGASPAPADVAAGVAASGVAVPPEWAALCDAVATFEPDSDEALLEHVAGEAAGVLAYADAVRARAETLLHGTGLDPAYVTGHHEYADEVGELASAVALVDRRFHAIYGALREWVAGGGILPHNAREWLGGGDAAAPHAGDGDVAA